MKHYSTHSCFTFLDPPSPLHKWSWSDVQFIANVTNYFFKYFCSGKMFKNERKRLPIILLVSNIWQTPRLFLGVHTILIENIVQCTYKLPKEMSSPASWASRSSRTSSCAPSRRSRARRRRSRLLGTQTRPATWLRWLFIFNYPPVVKLLLFGSCPPGFVEKIGILDQLGERLTEGKDKLFSCCIFTGNVLFLVGGGLAPPLSMKSLTRWSESPTLSADPIGRLPLFLFFSFFHISFIT